jgi:outer membrane lipoprotein carrier protein
MKTVGLFVLMVWGHYGFCSDASDLLQHKLNAIKTMSANFNQVVKANKREISHSSGRMALSRPGLFRWQTLSPMAQWVIADGHKVWVYDLDLEQVTVKKQSRGLGSTASLFLNNDADTVTREFNPIRRTTRGLRDYFELQATSSKATVQRVDLVFEGSDLTGMTLYDQLGQRTEVQLSHIQINKPLARSLFVFKVPKGVDVVEQ